MLAWQHNWFSPYLQGDEPRLGLLLLSLDTVSSLKLQAEIICAPMSTESTRELHSPRAESVPPLHSASPVLWGGGWGCWDRHGLIQPAAGHLSCSWFLQGRAKAACQASSELLPPAHPQQKGPHAARAGQWPLTWTELDCLTHLACLLEHTKDSLAPVAFSKLSVLPPCRHPLCASCTLCFERERPTLHVGVWPYLCHKHQSRAQTSSPSVLQFPSLSHIPRLQHLLTKFSL